MKPSRGACTWMFSIADCGHSVIITSSCLNLGHKNHNYSRKLTCRITLSGWLKLGALDRALEGPWVAGHKPRSFLPQVRTL